MRTFLLIVLLVLTVVLVSAGGATWYLLRSPERAVSALEWALASFTSLRLEWQEPQLDLGAGTLRASELHLLHQTENVAPLVSILDLDARFQWRELLTGRMTSARLTADNLVIYAAGSEQEKDPSPATWLRYARWLPGQLAIGGVHLITRQQTDMWIFPLRNLEGKRQNASSYRLQAQGDEAGEPLAMNLYLYALRSEQGLRGLQMRGEFHATASSRLAIVEGELLGGVEDFSYDFSVNIALPDIKYLLTRFPRAPDVAGALAIQGRMHGDLDGFTLSDARFRLHNPPAYEFVASGELVYAVGGETRLDASATGEMAKLEDLVDWIALDLSSLGGASAEARVSGAIGNLAVDRFVLQTRHANGLTVALDGSLGPGVLAGHAPRSSNRLALTLGGPSLSVLAPWLGELPVDPGPWTLQAGLTGDDEALRLDDIAAEFGEAGNLRLLASGRVGKIALEQPITATSVSDIAISLRAAAPDLATLKQWFDLPLPAAHSLTASARLGGTGNRLLLHAGKARLQGSDLKMKIADLQAILQGGETWQLAQLDGALSASLSDTSALSQYVENKIPSLGPVRATALVELQNGAIGLADINAAITSEDLQLRATGRIPVIRTGAGTALALQLEKLDTVGLVQTLREDYAYAEPLGHLAGSAGLEEDQGAWNLVNVDLQSAGSEVFALAVRGELSDLTGFPRADAVLALESDDSAWLRGLMGINLPSLSADLHSQTQRGQVRVQGEVRSGKTGLSLDTTILHDGQQPQRLDLTVSSPEVVLTDLGLEDQGHEVAGTEDDTRRNPLERLIESLPGYPLSLRLDLGAIRGATSSLDGVQVEISGENRQYLLRQLNILYGGAAAEFRGLIDLQARPPAITLGGQALALQLTGLVNDLGIDTDIKGSLNLRGGLTARGADADAWLASLQGSVAVALENAVIQGAAYDVLATDLLAWLYSGAALEKSTHVTCTMAKFALVEGIATTDSIYVESPRMIASGEGSLDLVQQTLDITLVPRSKNRLIQIPSSVTLKGPMKSPRTLVSPITATANASAEALMLVPALALKLFGIKLGPEQTEHPCKAALGK